MCRILYDACTEFMILLVLETNNLIRNSSGNLEGRYNAFINAVAQPKIMTIIILSAKERLITSTKHSGKEKL